MKETKHYVIRVTGKVQGVFYRQNTLEVAHSLGLKGYVQNCRDGSVLIEAEGREEVLEELVNWCKKGPDRAEVISVDVNLDEVKSYEDFEIIT